MQIEQTGLFSNNSKMKQNIIARKESQIEKIVMLPHGKVTFSLVV